MWNTAGVPGSIGIHRIPWDFPREQLWLKGHGHAGLPNLTDVSGVTPWKITRISCGPWLECRKTSHQQCWQPSTNAVNSVRKTVVSSTTTGCTKCHFIWAETPKLPLFLGTLSRKTPAMYTTCVGFTLFFAERWCLWPRPSVCTHQYGHFTACF